MLGARLKISPEPLGTTLQGRTGGFRGPYLGPNDAERRQLLGPAVVVEILGWECFQFCGGSFKYFGREEMNEIFANKYFSNIQKLYPEELIVWVLSYGKYPHH